MLKKILLYDIIKHINIKMHIIILIISYIYTYFKCFFVKRGKNKEWDI